MISKWWGVTLVLVLSITPVILGWFINEQYGFIFPRVYTTSRIPGLSLKINDYSFLIRTIQTMAVFKKNGVMVGDYEFGGHVSATSIHRINIVIVSTPQQYGHYKMVGEDPLFLSFDFSTNGSKGELLLYVNEDIIRKYNGSELNRAISTQLIVYLFQISNHPRFRGAVEFKAKEVWKDTETIKDVFWLETDDTK